MTFGKVMTAVPQDQASGQSSGNGEPAPADRPVLPAQSQEDTDAGWGERPEPEDDERLHGERPPHWAS